LGARGLLYAWMPEAADAIIAAFVSLDALRQRVDQLSEGATG
jgi:hypothetical protein